MVCVMTFPPLARSRRDVHLARLLRALACWAAAVVAFTPPAEAAEARWTTLFAFGDSYSDSGAGYVDGNGPTAIVYAARELGLPFTAATDPAAASQGRNYAVSGAQTGEGDGRRVKEARLGYGMQNQVRDFVAGVAAGNITFDSDHTLFFIAGGLNDRRLPTSTTVENLSRLVHQLHAAGARHFFIAVLPEEIPAFAEVGRRLNPALRALPAALQRELPDADIRLSDWGRYFDAVMREPHRYGIVNTSDACAGRAIFDQDTTPRGDPATYFYYHEGHPSTAVHRHVGRELAREFVAAGQHQAPTTGRDLGATARSRPATR
jgi:phospholipase/lecithinase/hemolysin